MPVPRLLPRQQSQEDFDHLDLSKNQISYNIATSIGEASEVNNTLTNLDLFRNHICNTSATSIAEAIKFNKSQTYEFL